VRHNIIFAFPNQQPGKLAENYITALHQLAQGCEYGGMTDQMVCDLGTNDELLSEHLLTLEQAKKFIG